MRQAAGQPARSGRRLGDEDHVEATQRQPRGRPSGTALSTGVQRNRTPDEDGGAGRRAPAFPGSPDLTPDACYRAVVSRDRRFEGRFVLGVTTTGVYCRPGCPARIPSRANVRFMPGPAAAEVAGFRPCRRCRPDASPDSPAWNGGAAVVTRALRLIDEGALDDGGLEALAYRLGMGGRHLRRIFLEKLGAPPRAVALTRRAHFARKLIEETPLAMTAVAAASGFGSVRRFNAAMTRTFRCPPSVFRGGSSNVRATSGLTLRLPYHPPLDWEALLAFLAARAIPGVETIEGDTYRRTIRAADETDARHRGRTPEAAWIEVRPAQGGAALLLTLVVAPGPGLDRIVRRVRRLFDLDADPVRIDRDLARDPLLAGCVQQHPGLRVPGAWDPFETAVRAVLGQQISVRGATTISGRLVEQFGESVETGIDRLTHLFPAPGAVEHAPFEKIGIPRARAASLRALAAAFHATPSLLDTAASLDDAVSRLVSIRGIGPWTAHYAAMRAYGEPDAFPSADLVLMKETGLAASALTARAETWRPWRAYAAMHLWRRSADRARAVRTPR